MANANLYHVTKLPLCLSLLFIISTPKVVVPSNFVYIRIVWAVFICSFFFYFDKFSNWIWRLPFAVHVKLKLSNARSCYVAITTPMSIQQRSLKMSTLDLIMLKCGNHFRISKCQYQHSQDTNLGGFSPKGSKRPILKQQ